MHSSFISDTRGAAMVEGVIVFPLFVIVLAAIIYYHQVYSTKLERNTQARRCAWEYSVHGCRPENIPDGCPIARIGENDFIGIDEGLDERASLFADGTGGAQAQSQSSFGDGAETANSILIGLIGLRQGIEARPSRNVRMPSILGGATRSIAGSYSVMCNERRRTVGGIIKDAYCSIKDSGTRLPGC